jgi:hypothetical protein
MGSTLATCRQNMKMSRALYKAGMALVCAQEQENRAKGFVQSHKNGTKRYLFEDKEQNKKYQTGVMAGCLLQSGKLC